MSCFVCFFHFKIKIQIYPEDEYELKYNLYPLLSGFVALPPLQLKTTTSAIDQVAEMDQTVLDELVSRYVPTHIYVLVNFRRFQSRFQFVLQLAFPFFVFLAAGEEWQQVTCYVPTKIKLNRLLMNEISKEKHTLQNI